MKRTKLSQRILPFYTKGEEVFNMVSHIAGGAFALAALALLVVFAALNQNYVGVLGGSIFGATMLLLYTMSSIYHGLPPATTAKKVFQIIDHCSIYLLIAGTYTPILLCSVLKSDPVTGWAIFAAIWIVAAVGIVLNAIDLKKFKIFSMISYLAMGWCVVIVWRPIKEALPTPFLFWLLAGGVAYTLGVILYGLGKKVRYMHSIWHLFVLAGSVLHFVGILLYLM